MATTTKETTGGKGGGNKLDAILSSAMNTAGVNVMMCDRDLNVTYANEATAKLVNDNNE